MTRLIVVSGDGHAAAPLDTYRPYLATKYHAALDELIVSDERDYRAQIAGPAHPTPEAMAVFDNRGAMAAGGEAGSYDLDVRLREMDAEGTAGEIVHSGTQSAPPLWYGTANHEYSPELQWVGVQAYHRWLADFMGGSGGRLFGVAEPGPTHDMDASVRELEWLAANGFVSVGVPGIIADPNLPPLTDAYYEPFWAACADLGLVLSVHAGWGLPQGMIFKFFDMMVAQMGGNVGDRNQDDIENFTSMVTGELSSSEDSPFRLDLGPRRVMWQLMLGGAFDRHPNLKLALTEIRAEWLPATLAELDRLADSAVSLAHKPSEYFAQHCAVSPSSIHRVEVEMRHEIGLKQLLFGTDYPHHEGTWPNTREWIKASMAGVPENEARLILGDNAIDFYGLDRQALTEVANRVGPEASEVLVDSHDVEDQLIAHFDQRAGYNREAEVVEVAGLRSAFDEDRKRLVDAG
jgi:predicted TIM-barrel fold metal-dependent hydrolase